MGRGSNAVLILLLLGVALLSLAAAPAAGDMRAVLAGAGGKVGHHHGIEEAVRRLRVSTRLEDVVAPELGMDDLGLGELHQRILGGGGKNSKGFVPDLPVCLPPAACAGPGQSYIGRGCANVYGCQGGKAPPSNH
ncbi:uncharacterized protein LOC127771819 [Oryza glaberrima]|uniref:uncharacterized protein LOC127771819 n=1 Tax=Oryza glaberrima TaxID=4538 RepID=UPI00224C26F3|nr:uncharacterized protein LOC127771819 [Oryza glaberrima]